MIRRKFYSFLAMVFSCILISAAVAQVSDPPGRTAAYTDLLKRLDKLKKEAEEEVQVVRKLGEPRRVERGAMPEIIVRNDEIFFNKEKLRFGEPLASWRKIISGTPRCSGRSMTLCIWDDLGIEVGTDHARLQKVNFFNIHLNLKDEHEEFIKQVYPNGRPGGDLDLNPHHPFGGYLELDGFGIDAETKFWEIRHGADVKRNLHCGLLDCEYPAGVFGDGHIYFILDARAEHGRAKLISLEAD